jgi:hypothetical protein
MTSCHQHPLCRISRIHSNLISLVIKYRVQFLRDEI